MTVVVTTEQPELVPAGYIEGVVSAPIPERDHQEERSGSLPDFPDMVCLCYSHSLPSPHLIS